MAPLSAVPPESDAPGGPELISAVIVMSDTGSPNLSVTSMTGCRASATPLSVVADGCVVILSEDGGGAVTAIAVEVTLASPVAAKRRVREPGAPVIMRSVKLACPLASVWRLTVPPRVPPPVAIVAVTTMPLWGTGLPTASRSSNHRLHGEGASALGRGGGLGEDDQGRGRAGADHDVARTPPAYTRRR